MKYISTRGRMLPCGFSDVLLMGLAPDGGLVMPQSYPQINQGTLESWRNLSYAELAFQILRLFIDDIPEVDLKNLLDKTYCKQIYATEQITPLKTLHDGVHILELSNGPTLAFKDMAMQLLGGFFEYVLAKRGETLNILGATSGDTGSSAEYAMRSKAGIQVFMLSPDGKMSEFQRAQMFSLADENIHNLAIRGMFDDCQDIVKAVQGDAEFKARYRIGTVNSINWARIVAQVVYYFKGYFDASKNNQQRISFCVPSGNFGNVCAGHIARMMGLPIARLIVATNENDVLDEFFRSGIYRPRSSRETYVTSSPSMDISKASNFERFIYDVCAHDSKQVEELYQQVTAGNGFDLSAHLSEIHQRFAFVSGKSTHQDRLNSIRQVLAEDGIFIDPHTADALKVARELRQKDEQIVCLETALPAKFAKTIFEATSQEVARPDSMKNIESLPQHFDRLDADATQVKRFIEATLQA